MNKTKIPYLDYTFSPIVGCSGEGCVVRDKCWARAQAKRRKHKCDACYAFLPHRHFDRLTQPLEKKKPSLIGVGFMGDLFDSKFGPWTFDQVFGVIAKAHWHKFLVLTKQSKNLLVCNFPKNLAVGVSVNVKSDLYRIEDLKYTNATLKVVSFEPLYEDMGEVDLKGIGWVIVGAETKNGRVTVMPDPLWVTNLQCRSFEAGAAFFAKKELKPLYFPSELPQGYPTGWLGGIRKIGR